MPIATSELKFGGRVAIVGTGHRAQLYNRAIAARPASTLVGLCDFNPVRMEYHNKLSESLGRARAPTYHPDDFLKMLEVEKVEVLVVTTVDSFHDEYIIPALDRGLRVLSEKPLTTDAVKCRRILDAVKRNESKGASCGVLFNYRFNPVHEKVFDVISSGEIGDVLSVHFEWLLDVHHGADYFRRWHRQKENSGGLMVHKSGHHFDLVRFWIGANPVSVFGFGNLSFYGDVAGKKHGYAKEYERATDADAAAKDPFAIHLGDNPQLKELYGTEAVSIDQYHRDMNVFAPGIGIEDDMSVVVKFDTGATMTYHLTAYSPWEGYRVMFNGSKGRLELEVVETTHRDPKIKGGDGDGAIHGQEAHSNAGKTRLSLHPLWEKSREVPVVIGTGGHGGGDDRMLSQIFGPLPGQKAEISEVAKRGANEKDGAWALAIGLAANESFKTGKLINIEELLGGPI